jgi:hypothetical protein
MVREPGQTDGLQWQRDQPTEKLDAASDRQKEGKQTKVRFSHSYLEIY